MTLTKTNKTVMDLTSIVGTGPDEVAAGDHVHVGIALNTDWYISPSGSDVTGDGSLGTPWYSIAKAFEELKDIRINKEAYLTINVLDGLYDFNEETVLNHPDGERIEVIGNTPPTRGMISVISYTGTAGNWFIEIGTDTDPSTDTDIGDYILIRNLIGSVVKQRFLMAGCLEVIGVSGTTITARSRSESIELIPPGTYGGDITILKARIRFQFDSNGLVINNGFVLDRINNIVLIGDGGGSLVQENEGISVKGSSSLKCGPEVGVSEFHKGFAVSEASNLDATGTASSANSRSGYSAEQSSNLLCNDSIASGNTAGYYSSASEMIAEDTFSIGNTENGYENLNSSYLLATTSLSYFNLEDGYKCYGVSSISCQTSHAYKNIGNGFYANQSSNILCDSSTSIENTLDGYKATFSSTIITNSSTTDTNLGNGYLSTYGSSIQCTFANALNNSNGGGFKATDHGCIDARNAAADANSINFEADNHGYINATGSTAVNEIIFAYSPSLNLESLTGAWIIG